MPLEEPDFTIEGTSQFVGASDTRPALPKQRRWWRRNRPFWIASLSLHVVFFGILAFLTITESGREMLAGRQREDGSAHSLAPGRPAARQLYQRRVDEHFLAVDTAPDERLDANPPFGARLADPKTFGGFDLFAFETINTLARGPTTVVFLVSDSWLRAEEDLPKVRAGIEQYADLLDRHLNGPFRARGKWVLYSFGRSASRRCGPTGGPDELRRAARDLPSARSPVENVTGAINAALEEQGGKSRFTLLAVVMDRGGSDVHGDLRMEVTIAQLHNKLARLYVFGREANFGRASKDPRLGLGEGLLEFWTRAGEAPGKELWKGAFLWGADSQGVPSGSAPCGLGRLAQSAAGVYYLIEPESDYDAAKLSGGYLADVCSLRRYTSDTQRSPLRTALAGIWQGLDAMDAPVEFSCRAEADRAAPMALQALQWCEQQAVALDGLRAGDADKALPLRWRAHAQVTRAELLRRRHALEQYVVCLQQSEAKFAELVPGQLLELQKANQPRGPDGPARFAETKEAIERVMTDHGGTPWAALARRMRDALAPGLDLKPSAVRTGDDLKPPPEL